MFSKFQEDGDDGFQRLLALTLGREVERRIATLRERTTRAKAQRVAQILLRAVDTG